MVLLLFIPLVAYYNKISFQDSVEKASGWGENGVNYEKQYSVKMLWSLKDQKYL